MKRCDWPGEDPLYIEYHDHEWGVPLSDDQKLFEFLILETMQAGLSWITILRKRNNFRKAFAGFNPQKVARFDEKKIKSLLKDTGIIRNEAKIRAAVSNATAFLQIQKEQGSFADYIWSFVNHAPLKNKWESMKDVPTKTELAEQISKDLKKRGFKFTGPTIIYAHMQATGMVNDHIVDCFRHREISGMRI